MNIFIVSVVARLFYFMDVLLDAMLVETNLNILGQRVGGNIGCGAVILIHMSIIIGNM